MGWRVRAGYVVSHDGMTYRVGDIIPCGDGQAAQMPHAVEWIEAVVEPAAVDVSIKSVEATARGRRK